MSQYRIVEHTVRCQHTRDRPAGAELGRENEMRLHVKQYVPLSNQNPKPGDVTLIGAQANAFPKEMYEPFWDDLSERMQASGRSVRGIWIADIASQGASGIINEAILGPDASWWDHGRDLQYLINQFQDDIPHPIIGVGHSVGASHLAHLSLLHPRLLQSLVLVDPIFQRDLGPHTAFARLSTFRRDRWPSRKVAEGKFRSNKFYQRWDPRVLEKWLKYGFRDLPTEQYPDIPKKTDDSGPPVTLATTAAQEVYFYVRAGYPDDRLLLLDGDPEDDIHLADRQDLPFNRPESQELWRRIPELKPSVLYVFGEKSEASPLEYREDKMERTGKAYNGSGGPPLGRVQSVVLDCGHLVAMERPKECADATAGFIDCELGRWDDEERRKREIWSSMTRRERVDINDKWREHLSLERKAVGEEKPKL